SRAVGRSLLLRPSDHAPPRRTSTARLCWSTRARRSLPWEAPRPRSWPRTRCASSVMPRRGKTPGKPADFRLPGAPPGHPLDSIPGVGAVTAAVLTAFVDSDRFATRGKRVAYLGAMPSAVASGVDRVGQARGPCRWVMSRRGNDLLRHYLWMAVRSGDAPESD